MPTRKIADLPYRKICRNPSHDPPNMIVLPPGIYEHECPGCGQFATLTDKGNDLLVRAAPTHVAGVRAHLVDLASNEDFAALGRVFDAVADSLVSAHPEMEIRGQ